MRLAPHIFRIPKPEPKGLARIRASWVLPGLVLVVPGVMTVTRPALVAGDWPVVVILLVVAVTVWRPRRRTEQATSEWNRRNRPLFAQWLADGVSAHLHRLWSARRLDDFDVAARKILVAARSRHEDRPLIFCFGPVDIPDTVPAQFEPFIVEPTRRLWQGLLRAAPLMLVYLGLAACKLLFGRYLPVPFSLTTLACLLLSGVGLVIFWAWHAGVRPYYLRLAPGLIQVLRFTVSNDRPAITDWPIDSKTVVVVSYASGSTCGGIHVVILREDQKQEIDISSMRDPDEVATQFWQAVLSTAPTPDLPDDRLAG